MSAPAIQAEAAHAVVEELGMLHLPAEPAAQFDLRGALRRIQEAMSEDDASVPRGIWERPLKRANPEAAAREAVEALRSGGADLQVAGWLVRAWVMTRDFAGARDGLRLLHTLCRRDWATLRPVPSAADPEARERAFAWVVRHLPESLGRVPLTRAVGGTGFTWEQREAALYRERTQRAARERPGPGEATPAQIDEAAAATPTDFYLRTDRELAETLQAALALQQLLHERWDGVPPSLEPVHEQLARIRAWVAAQLADRPAAPDPVLPPERPDRPRAPEEPFPPRPGPPIRSRDDAYALLAAAADYLARTEPHSPAPWLVRRAVGWGGMGLGELLTSLIGEGYDLKTLRSLLGLAGEGRP
jgi:type VI secretion system protein ImpA